MNLTSSLTIPENMKDFNSFVKLMEDNDRDKNPEKTQQIIKFYETLAKGEIPEMVPEALTYRNNGGSNIQAVLAGSSIHKLGYFTTATQKFAKAIKNVVGDKIVLDPLAGVGYLAKALRQQGVKTIASDNYDWPIYNKNVTKMDAVEALKTHGEDIHYLIIGWAYFESVVDYELLLTVRNLFPHIKIINIGEDEGGCTNSHDFWRSVKFVDSGDSRKLNEAYDSMISYTDMVAIVQ